MTVELARGWSNRMVFAALTLGLGLLLSACGSRPINRAPVEDRGRAMPPVQMSPSASMAGNGKVLPGAENAGKPGYYTVKPGDTLIRIGLEAGQNWRDIARWNNMDNPNQIEVGQVLRVAPPTAAVAANGVVTRPVTAAGVQAQPVPGAAGGVVTKPLGPQGSTAGAGGATVGAATPAPASATTDSHTAGDEPVNWAWPAPGPVLAGFDDVRNKGLDIGGVAGEPVLAAAEGRVVYAGAGLRGYGNLIIIKHNNTFLTAYAHNQTLLVKEDQAVQRGQKIAEMGNTDADRVKLHFEVRRQGKPVDPAKYLPAR